MPVTATDAAELSRAAALVAQLLDLDDRLAFARAVAAARGDIDNVAQPFRDWIDHPDHAPAVPLSGANTEEDETS